MGVLSATPGVGGEPLFALGPVLLRRLWRVVRRAGPQGPRRRRGAAPVVEAAAELSAHEAAVKGDRVSIVRDRSSSATGARPTAFHSGRSWLVRANVRVAEWRRLVSVLPF